jgi:hypothetical protein
VDYILWRAFDDHSGRTASNESGFEAPAHSGYSPQRLSIIYGELALTKERVTMHARCYPAPSENHFAKVNAMAVAAGAPLISNTAVDSYISSVLPFMTEVMMTETGSHHDRKVDPGIWICH